MRKYLGWLVLSVVVWLILMGISSYYGRTVYYGETYDLACEEGLYKDIVLIDAKPNRYTIRQEDDTWVQQCTWPVFYKDNRPVAHIYGNIQYEPLDTD